MSDGNNISTTMTLDQQQFLREMAKQVTAIAKSSRALVEMKQAAGQSGQGTKQAFDLSLPSIRQLTTSIVGFGGVAQGVLAGVRGAVQLVTADFEKLNRRAVEALDSTRTPANSIREAALNVRPEELDWLQGSVTKLATDPRINAPVETGARVVSGIRSAAGNVPLKDVERTAEVTLRGIGPDRPDAAEQFGIALMDAMSSERRYIPDLTPEAAFGGLLALQAGSHMAGIQDTAKSFGPLQAALGVHGQRFHETAAPFGALTVFNKDQTGQVSAEGFRKTSEELMSFVPENDAKRLERLDSMFNESLNSTDFAGTKDTEKRQKYRDRLAALDLKDPSRQAEEMVKLLEEIQSAYREGSDTRTRLGRDIARLKIAQTHQRSTDIKGMPIDVPLSEVQTFNEAKTPVEKLWTLATKTPNLSKAAEANIEFGRGKTREFFVGWMHNDPLITKSIRDAEKEMPALTNERSADFEKWVTKLNANRLQVMARSQQRLQSATQQVELASTLDQQFGLAKKTVESMHAKNPTNVVGRWIDTSLKPIFEQQAAMRDPIGVAVPKLQTELQRIEKDLTEGRPVYPPGAVAKATPFGFIRPKPIRFDPLQGQEREQREAQAEFTRSLIEILKTNKAEMAPPARPVPIAPPQQPKPVKVEAVPELTPAGQKVGAIGTPLIPGLGQFLTASAFSAVPVEATPAATPVVPLRSPQQRIRADIIDRALSTAQTENVKGVTREGLETTAEQWGDDTTGFAIRVKDFFHAEAERRREESKDWQIDVDPATGEGKPYKDASVDRLFRAGGEIQDAPIRELQRTDAQRVAVDRRLAQSKAAESVRAVRVDRTSLIPVSESEAVETVQPQPVAASGQAVPRRKTTEELLEQAGKIQRGESVDKPVALGLSEPFDAAGFMAAGQFDQPFKPIPVKTPSAALIAALTPVRAELPDVESAADSVEPERIATGPLKPSRPRILPKPFVPSDPERHAKALAAVEASHQPRTAQPVRVPKPFVPSDPERTAKAWEAVERQRVTSAGRREGLDQPLPSAFQGNPVGKPVAANLPQINRAPLEMAPSQFDPNAALRREEGHKAMREADRAQPRVTVQGGDTKPVVAAIEKQTALLEKLIQVTQANQQQPKPGGTASNAGRERTTTRPAAALAK